MSLREGAEKALNALECTGIDGTYLLHEEAIDALRTALAEAEEPVAWYHPSAEGYDSAFRDHSTVMACDGGDWSGWVPLYAHPPRREPLTEERIDALCTGSDGLPASHIEFARAIERAHGIGGDK